MADDQAIIRKTHKIAEDRGIPVWIAQREITSGNPRNAGSALTILAPALRAVTKTIASAKLADRAHVRSRARADPDSCAMSEVTSQTRDIRRIDPHAGTTRSSAPSSTRRAPSSPSVIAEVCMRKRLPSTKRSRSEAPVGV